jgi:hypothetical protein
VSWFEMAVLTAVIHERIAMCKCCFWFPFVMQTVLESAAIHVWHKS